MRERTDPQPHDERTALTDRLRFQRQTVRRKAEGLSEAHAHQAFLPSPLMTVAGLVSHLRWNEHSWNEHSWFEVSLLGLPNRGPWTEGGHPDVEMMVDDVPLAQLLDEYDEQCARSNEIVAGLPLDTVERSVPDGEQACSPATCCATRPDRSGRSWKIPESMPNDLSDIVIAGRDDHGPRAQRCRPSPADTVTIPAKPPHRRPSP